MGTRRVPIQLSDQAHCVSNLENSWSSMEGQRKDFDTIKSLWQGIPLVRVECLINVGQVTIVIWKLISCCVISSHQLYGVG